MGRIKTSFVKHIDQELFEKHSEKFSSDFNKNKEIVEQLVDFESQRLRNIVVGYITRMKKRAKK